MRDAPKARKGAMLAFVGVTMVGLLSMLAVVVDMSRVHVQKNQLQTAADASALAGVVQLFSFPDSVDEYAVRYAQANTVLKVAPAIAPADIVCGIYDNNADTFTSASCTSASSNALQVRVTATAQSMLPGVLDMGSRTVSATATAWLANVNGTNCVKPFGVSHFMLTQLLQPTNPNIGRTLDETDISIMRGMSAADLTVQVKYGSPTDPGNFGALDMPNPASNGNGANLYRDNIGTCNPQNYERGDLVHVETGNMVGPTRQGAQDFCTTYVNGTGACLNSQGVPGEPAKIITYVPPTTCVGSNCWVTVVDMVGFAITRVTGTEVIGHFMPLSSGGSLSNSTTAIKRPILVR